jgi:hypothetical protein
VQAEKRTLKRLCARVSGDCCRAGRRNELSQEILHDGAAAAHGLPARATCWRQSRVAEAANSQPHLATSGSPGQGRQRSSQRATQVPAAACAGRTFAAGHQKQAGCARVRVGIRGPLGVCAASKQRRQTRRSPARARSTQRCVRTAVLRRVSHSQGAARDARGEPPRANQRGARPLSAAASAPLRAAAQQQHGTAPSGRGGRVC